MRPWSSALVVVVAIVVGAAPVRDAAACIQFYGTDLKGHGFEFSGGPPGVIVDALNDHRDHQRRATAALPAMPAADDFRGRSDYAAALVYRGDARGAIAMLEAVERDHPGEYQVAANLGTAYELAGDDAAVLRWIAEGIRRNPDSHQGTEWLHVRILEAKRALAADPSWLATHSVAGVDFGAGALPTFPTAFPPDQDLATVAVALQYQLHERMGFVAPPDPIVADLLFDLGNDLALTTTVEHARAVYDLSLRYGPAKPLVATRRASLPPSVKRPWSVPPEWALALGGLALLLVMVGSLVLVGRWFVRRGAATRA